MTQKTYLQGEPDLNPDMTCRIDECGSHAVVLAQGNNGVMWCREGHVSLQVWSDRTYEWVEINGNYPWQ